MRRLVVNEFMSLDGVVQAPGAVDEDPSGGFRHGGWHMQYLDERSQDWVLGSILEAGAFLLGRRTYEIFAAYWPSAPDAEQVIADPLNTKPKYVASRTLSEPLGWQNSRVIADRIPEAVAALKRQEGGDVHVIGSTGLVRALVEDDLVDEFRMMIDPVILGGGKRLFPEDGVLRGLRLVESETVTTGAILATYAPATVRSG